MSYEAWWGKPRFHYNEATILTETFSAVEAWKVRIAMFLRHDPSSLCNTTGALLVVALSAAISSALREMRFGRHPILNITITDAPNRNGCGKVDLLSNFALRSGASWQPA
ncbi:MULTISPECIES: hypothetical protein [Rhizobium]|uniref:hypothetical protein n=1 Tax=Rhizobium TaxID=379 RepID=UPI001FE1D28F|nr:MULTISPECIES: hypothetical protein [Rhizobium]